LINQNKKREILRNILKSNEFAGSKNSKALLTYLIDSSIKGDTPMLWFKGNLRKRGIEISAFFASFLALTLPADGREGLRTKKL